MRKSRDKAKRSVNVPVMGIVPMFPQREYIESVEVKVLGEGKLETCSKKHAEVKSSIQAWLSEAKEADWRTPADIKESYSHASILRGKIVVFNLKGRKYRLAVKIAYNTNTVLILKIGTHAEYSKWKLTGGK